MKTIAQKFTEEIEDDHIYLMLMLKSGEGVPILPGGSATSADGWKHFCRDNGVRLLRLP